MSYFNSAPIFRQPNKSSFSGVSKPNIGQSNESYNDSLYITLQYLRTVNGNNKYHWALYLTEKKAPAGYLIHATDTGRKALDLYKEVREVGNPLRSKSMVVCLKIGGPISLKALKSYTASVHLMDPRYLPRGEVQWTCRVWVKEVLQLLHNAGALVLPSSLNSLEEHCLAFADQYLPLLGKAPPKVFNEVDWALSKKPGSAVPGGSRYTTRADNRHATAGGQDRYYGSSPMDVDSTGGRYYGPSPMAVYTATTSRYYGPSPMITETHGR